jgi:uncharacterized protein YwqG
MTNLIPSKLSDSRLSRVAKDLAAMLQPAIRLLTLPCEDEELPPGSTRIGGKPDLADNIVWPSWNGKPLTFLAQINLADLGQFSYARVLPKQGWLLFFYNDEQSTWGYNPNDEGSWAVIYMPNVNAKLERRGLPSASLPNGFYHPCKVKMQEIITLPAYDSPAIGKLELNHVEREVYWDLLEEVYADRKVCHQILGHPQPIQGDMQLECQLVSNGLYCGDWTVYKDPRAIKLAKNAVDWRLLFQLDSDENTGMMWADVGRLYFWIRHADLRKRNFGKSWMILQCY